MLQSGCFYIHPLLFNIKIVEQNKEANHLLLQGQSHFASQNKEAKSSPHQGVRILLRKTRRLNPLLTKGFGFCFAKQGGLDAGFY